MNKQTYLFSSHLILICLSAVCVSVHAGTISVDAICTLGKAIKSVNTNVNEAGCAEIGPDSPPHIINITSDIDYLEDDPAQVGNAVPFITADVTINGNGFSITRSESATDDFRFFAVASGKTVLNNITLSGGYLNGFNGGAIFVDSRAELELNQVNLSNNKVEGEFPGGRGGAIYANSERFNTVKLTNSILSNNSARIGGGIYLGASTATINNSQFLGNVATDDGPSADGGGGIFLSRDSTLSLTDSTLSQNRAVSPGAGGGINIQDSTMTASNCILSENSALEGGGISVSRSMVTITNSTLSGNSSQGFSTHPGGGVLVESNSVVTISQSTLSGNSTGGDGGGVSVSQSEVRLTNNTLSNNSANFSGGGIATGIDTELVLLSNTLTGNSAKSGGGIGVTTFATSISLASNIVSGNRASEEGSEIFSRFAGIGKLTNLLGHRGLTSAQAFEGFTPFTSSINATADGDAFSQHRPTRLEAILQPLSDNGCTQVSGDTATAACVKTHALPENSPAINSSDQSVCEGNNITQDQRGELRDDGACDIGSYEGFIADDSCYTTKTKNGQVLTFCL